MGDNKKTNYHAILLGTNNYQEELLANLDFCEKDCNDLQEVLMQPAIGLPKENIKTILGSQLTLDVMRKELIRVVQRDRTEDDVVIIYYSGHGFRTTENEETFLASHDSSFESINHDYFNGFSLNNLQKIISKSKAGYVILILDACYSGAFFSKEKGTNKSTAKNIINDKNFKGFVEQFTSIDGHLILASSKSHEVSRELPNLKNSLFTYWLLKGLRGEAADPLTDELTPSDLIKYLSKQLPKDQLPILNHRTQGYSLILGQFKSEQHPVITEPSADANLSETITFQSYNPLHGYDSRITTLVKQFSERSKTDFEQAFLEASLLFTASRSSNLIKIDIATDSKAYPNQKHLPLAYKLAKKYYEQTNDSEPRYFELKEGNLSIIPLNSNKSEILILFGGPNFKLIKEQIQILRHLYSNSSKGKINKDDLHGSILDNLKTYSENALPTDLFTRRKTLFSNRLKQMTVHFQAIVHLDKQSTHTDSFEALARDKETNKAPIHLFKAAELWKGQLMTQLDMYFLEHTIELYKNLIENSKEYRRSYARPELGINVYPDTLLDSKYYSKLLKLTTENNLLYGKNLVLEISEKQPLPLAEDVFKKKLKHYIQTIGLKFAIDDYGSANANFTRLLLRPTYIKIDRTILQDQVDAIEACVMNVNQLISSRNLAPAKLVFEGYDEAIASKISLDELYDAGVRYIQGNWFSQPQANIERLPKDTYDKATQQLQNASSYD